MLDKSASFILNKEDFQKMDNNELEDCAEYLGTLNLDYSVKTYIWSRLEKVPNFCASYTFTYLFKAA